MSKSVMLPLEVYNALCKYFIFANYKSEDDAIADERIITKWLSEKMESRERELLARIDFANRKKAFNNR